MKRMVLGLAALGLLLGGVPGRARADIILDQSNTFADDGIFVQSTQDAAQTFTVGVAGTLSRVEVALSNWTGPTHPFLATQPLQFDVRATTAGAPNDDNNAVLAFATIPSSSVHVSSGFPTFDSFVSVDVSAFNVAVTPGEVLAIVLRSSDPSGYLWADAGTNPYPGGGRSLIAIMVAIMAFAGSPPTIQTSKSS